jgi:hypothetical protein
MPYFPQHHPDFNSLRHLLLMYGDARRPWTSRDMVHGAAHMNAEGTADDWLFDSFLFLNLKASSGHDFSADVNLGTTMAGEGDFFAVCSPHPAEKRDWDELLGFYLGPSGALRTLEASLKDLRSTIRYPFGPKRNVILMIPYPHITQKRFGPLATHRPSLDFSTAKQNLARASEQRLEATRWFVDEVVRRFREDDYSHIHLLGVYWMFETVYRGWDVDDHWVLKELRVHIRDKGLKFFWIPFWSTYNVHLLDNYQDYYFDLAFLQPNYMFYKRGKNIAQAAEAARTRNAGIEMEYFLELPEPIAVEGERHRRFREYLNGGITYGYMTDAACAHFQGVGALERMRGHDDQQEREFYEDLYRFLKGEYRLK